MNELKRMASSWQRFTSHLPSLRIVLFLVSQHAAADVIKFLLLVNSAAFMLASYDTAVSFEFGISILRFMMVWLLPLPLCCDTHTHAHISQLNHLFFPFIQWFNGSYNEEANRKRRNTFQCIYFFIIFDTETSSLRVDVFLFKKECSFLEFFFFFCCWKIVCCLLPCCCHSFEPKTNLFISSPHHLPRAYNVRDARYSLIGITFEMRNIKWQEYGFEFSLGRSCFAPLFRCILIAIYIKSTRILYEFSTKSSLCAT